MSPLFVHLAVYPALADWEVGYAIAHLNADDFRQQPGRFSVKTVSASREPVVTKGGITILPDLTLDEFDPHQSRMLILPGADSAFSGGIDSFAAMAARCLAAGTPVAAICGATAALARAGLLDRVAHTSNAPEFLAMTGYQGAAHYQPRLAVTAGNLITASGVAPVEFAVEIFRLLDSYTPATLNSWQKLFKQQDAEGFFELMAEQQHG